MTKIMNDIVQKLNSGWAGTFNGKRIIFANLDCFTDNSLVTYEYNSLGGLAEQLELLPLEYSALTIAQAFSRQNEDVIFVETKEGYKRVLFFTSYNSVYLADLNNMDIEADQLFYTFNPGV